ncbi:MAG: hypothetical protein KAT77_03685 [Nanoarchaeota archaeon]|nr:hypothetical protein [Nanoarchaeota archaeon]
MCLDDMCFNKEAAEEEKRISKDPKGYEGYTLKGCYTCDGHNSDCEYYIPKKKMDFLMPRRE